ncbi:hypothetical protein SAMN04515656_1022 [Eubacterium aggregans]|uniref:Uncharacterized protein n=1 Tax=Eubacterium aggregans TaxID=81409 RepID=A0A1H3XDJ3_9FIRM|nr:hypothetical protein [Eubacterium aggregans]SDZ97021.1 hypothetical protein SAMN04515656_1022 [Eubacterium aggregans]
MDSVRQSYFNSTSNVQSKVNAILNSKGNVNGAAISGVIDAFRTKIRAQRNVEQLQDVRAILFEDTIAGSPTYGAMSLGTQGFAIASEMLPDGSDWDWRTFGTSQGFVADLMVIGKIIGQCAEIGLDNATFLLGQRDADGVISSPVMSYQDGVFALNVSGTDVGNQLDEMKIQIDGKIETWYQSTDPSLRWATIAAQTQHTGDLWYKTTDQTTWRWTGTAWTKQDAPAAVFDAIDGKSAIYVSQPIPPYEVGDLWAQGSSGDLMRCTTARSSGSYTASDWTKASKYTDDTAITNFITGDYADDLEDIRGQVDAKAETWYQAADPSTAWTTTAIKTQHTGDLWYKTTDQTTWRWTGTAWTKQDAPAAIFDAIDGKSAIYVSQPTPPYEVGDLWVLAADTTISALPYTKGTVLVATTARATGSFVATDWTQKIDIATWLSNQINTDTGAIDAIKVIIDSSGLTLKNIIGTNVFYADVSGNLTLAGTLQAAKGTFLGEVRNYESNGYIGLSMTGSQLKFYSKNYQDDFIGGIENKGKGTSEADKLRLHIYADSGDQLSIGNNTSGVRDQISISDNGDTWILHPRNNGNVYLGGYDGNAALAAKVQSGTPYVDTLGTFTVYNGSKNRAVKTKNYGIVNLGAYETTTPMFGDIGYAVIQEDGKVYVCIDPIFCECLEDSGVFYHVFTQAYGDGRIEKIERHEEYFVVYGDPGTELSWEIKARQQQFCERLADGNRIEEENEEMQIIDGYLMGDAYMAEYTNSIIDDAESYITEYEEVNL